MKYVVVRPRKGMSEVLILDEGIDLHMPFESWALNNGTKIIFANTKMHKILASQHLAGPYSTGAFYAYTYDEMVQIMTSHLGPSDRERYESLVKGNSDRTSIRVRFPRLRAAFTWANAGLVGLRLVEFSLVMFMGVIKLLMWLVLIPLIIRWVKRK